MSFVKVKKFYMRDLLEMSLEERYMFLLLNEWSFNLKIFAIPLNPLKWCLLDLFKIIGLPFCFLLWLLVILLYLPFEARKVEEKYSDREWLGVFMQDVTLYKRDN